MFWELLFPVLEPWAGEPGVELGLPDPQRVICSQDIPPIC